MTNIALSNTCSNNNSMAMEFQVCFSITILPFITKKIFLVNCVKYFDFTCNIFKPNFKKTRHIYQLLMCNMSYYYSLSLSLFRPLTSLCPRVLYLCS